LFNEKAEIIPGFINKLNAWLPKFFPKSFVERIAGNIYEPRQEDKYSFHTHEKIAGLQQQF